MHDRKDVVLCEVACIIRNELLRLKTLCDDCRNLDLDKSFGSSVNSSPVLVYDIFTLLEEGLLDVLLDKVDCLILGKDTADLEECSLHDCLML